MLPGVWEVPLTPPPTNPTPQFFPEVPGTKAKGRSLLLLHGLCQCLGPLTQFPHGCPFLQRLSLWVEGGNIKPAVVGVEWTVLTTVGTLVSQTGLQRPSVLCHISDGTLGPDCSGVGGSWSRSHSKEAAEQEPELLVHCLFLYFRLLLSKCRAV